MDVSTEPISYSVNASFDSSGRNPRVTVDLRGKWSVTGMGVAGVGAHGTYHMSLSKEEGSRFNKPHKLELDGIVSDKVPEDERHKFAKMIKEQLKSEIKAMLEKTHGHLSYAINNVW